jgi:hypothetical protein
MQRFSSLKIRLISLGLLRVILPVGIFFFGVYGLNRYHASREIYLTTLEEYLRTLPDRDWVELREVQLDLTKSVYTVGDAIFFQTVEEVYIPMRTPNQLKEEQVQAMLVTRDSATRDLVKQMKALAGEDAWQEFIAKNYAQLYPQRTVRGSLPSWPLELDGISPKKRDSIVHRHGNLKWEFVAIEESGKPQIWPWLALFVAAFPLAWVCWLCPQMWGSKTPRTNPPPLPI